MWKSGHIHCCVLTSYYQSHAPCGWWIPVGKAGRGQAHLSSCCNVDTHGVVSCPFTVKHMLRVDGKVDIMIGCNAGHDYTGKMQCWNVGARGVVFRHFTIDCVRHMDSCLVIGRLSVLITNSVGI